MIELHRNFSEAPRLRSSIPHPKTGFSKYQIASRRIISWPKLYTKSFFETALAFRRFWVKKPRLSEKKVEMCYLYRITCRGLCPKRGLHDIHVCRRMALNVSYFFQFFPSYEQFSAKRQRKYIPVREAWPYTLIDGLRSRRNPCTLERVAPAQQGKNPAGVEIDPVVYNGHLKPVVHATEVFRHSLQKNISFDEILDLSSHGRLSFLYIY